MNQTVSSLATGRGPASAMSWPRVKFTLIWSAVLGALLSLPMETSTWIVVIRAIVVGVAAMLAFSLFERWPGREPRWWPRWVLQLVAIVVVVPVAALFAYWLTTGGHPNFSGEQKRVVGYMMLTFMGVFFAPWIALGALLRQREAFARTQALAFDLERSELERKASDARLRLLQAQVAPHFLFNTLANVQALVDAGSPQASAVLKSLIAYLRAAVPRLDDPATTLDHEADLVRAYLEVMRMRMPDRLTYALQVDPSARRLACPPMTLLTLVENAVRHGIDPGEEGGHIDVHVEVRAGRCHLRVADTGVGLRAAGSGLGTGLSTLKERLALAFRGDAHLKLTEREPHGVLAEVDFPAREVSA
ncbi:MAG TPA: histidine kinase [Steroidobacteraceae bacterium]|nr:histidine kinase [Steroidobacteraceae bacterium]